MSICRFSLRTLQTSLVLKYTINSYRPQWPHCPVKVELISHAKFILVAIIQSASISLFLVSPHHSCCTLYILAGMDEWRWGPASNTRLISIGSIDSSSTPIPQMAELRLLCYYCSIMDTYHIFLVNPLPVDDWARSASWHAQCTCCNELGSVGTSLTSQYLFNSYQCRYSFDIVILILCTILSVALAQCRVSDADNAL